MTFDEWWMEMKPAEVDDLKPQFMDCWARAQIAADSVVGMPQGYEPHEIPADYTGPLFIEGQMNAAHASGKLEAAQHILDMWRQPWGVAGRPFIKLLEAYVEELK